MINIIIALHLKNVANLLITIGEPRAFDMFNLTDKKIILTGAGGGLGTVLLSRLHDAGAKVLACDRPDAGIDQTKAHDVYRFDLADKQQMSAAITQMLRDETPDCVIANAGYSRAELMTDVTSDHIEDELRVNLTATMHLTSAVLPVMRRQGGNFVFVSSVNAARHVGNPVYSAAKAGLESWMRGIATEEAPNNIRANAVAPGSIQTPAWDHRLKVDPEIVRAVSSHYPMQRFVTPDEVAQVVMFLASDTASGVTGAVVPVDAGLGAGNPPFVASLNP